MCRNDALWWFEQFKNKTIFHLQLINGDELFSMGYIIRYLLHSSLSIGCRLLSIAVEEHCFQSGLFWMFVKSILEASPPQCLLKMICQVIVVSANSPQLWRVGFSLSAFMRTEILCRRCFRSFSRSSVNGSRSIWLNFLPCRVVSEWCEMRSFHSESINFSRFCWSSAVSIVYCPSPGVLVLLNGHAFFKRITKLYCERRNTNNFGFPWFLKTAHIFDGDYDLVKVLWLNEVF